MMKMMDLKDLKDLAHEWLLYFIRISIKEC
jgi:hypothetical protein